MIFQKRIKIYSPSRKWQKSDLLEIVNNTGHSESQILKQLKQHKHVFGNKYEYRLTLQPKIGMIAHILCYQPNCIITKVGNNDILIKTKDREFTAKLMQNDYVVNINNIDYLVIIGRQVKGKYV
jgi:hypothetical protein